MINFIPNEAKYTLAYKFLFSFFLFLLLYFNIFCLLKIGSSVLRNQRYFDRVVVGCVMCSPCLFEYRLHFVFSFYRFLSSQPGVSTRVGKFLLLPFSVFRRFLVLV